MGTVIADGWLQAVTLCYRGPSLMEQILSPYATEALTIDVTEAVIR